ncbi:MAG: hybrid sensor histidine kinase/response regulator, partial [Treponema sp.]|nr:hybrid sensor histidine kinase/response regulator [Treponema sp.]
MGSIWRKTKRNFSLVFFSFAALVVLVISLYTGFLVNSISGYLEQSIEEWILSSSRALSKLVTAEELEELRVPEDMKKPLFRNIRNRLISFGNQHHVLYAFYFRINDQGLQQYIIDNDLDPATIVNLATPPEPIVEDEVLQVLSDGMPRVKKLGQHIANFDHLISSYAPVINMAGRVVAIAGVDISDVELLKIHSRTKILAVLLIISNILIISAGFVSFYAHRRKEKERNAALTQAENASRAKSDFLANMSHEMRTPMNAIIGMTSIAKLSEDPEKKEYCLGKIDEASNHLLGVINDILDMSKIEANKFELSLADFSFEKMIQKVVDVNSFRVEEKHQGFTVHIDRNIPDRLYGDDQHLAQVITNLLSNAVKFTPEFGSITLNAGLGKEENGIYEISICVTDSGIGISAEQQARLFSSFEQADSSTSRKFGGTGLGLAISKRIVEMMGGSIRVESEPGRGSNFIFTVNLKKSVSKPDTEILPDAVIADNIHKNENVDNFEGRHILLAEDVDINREIIFSLLEPTHLSMDCAENGSRAVEMFAAAPDIYDMIFMDIQM